MAGSAPALISGLSSAIGSGAATASKGWSALFESPPPGSAPVEVASPETGGSTKPPGNKVIEATPDDIIRLSRKRVRQLDKLASGKPSVLLSDVRLDVEDMLVALEKKSSHLPAPALEKLRASMAIGSVIHRARKLAGISAEALSQWNALRERQRDVRADNSLEVMLPHKLNGTEVEETVTDDLLRVLTTKSDGTIDSILTESKGASGRAGMAQNGHSDPCVRV